jgi:hypothetical protein
VRSKTGASGPERFSGVHPRSACSDQVGGTECRVIPAQCHRDQIKPSRSGFEQRPPYRPGREPLENRRRAEWKPRQPRRRYRANRLLRTGTRDSPRPRPDRTGLGFDRSSTTWGSDRAQPADVNAETDTGREFGRSSSNTPYDAPHKVHQIDRLRAAVDGLERRGVASDPVAPARGGATIGPSDAVRTADNSAATQKEAGGNRLATTRVVVREAGRRPGPRHAEVELGNRRSRGCARDRRSESEAANRNRSRSQAHQPVTEAR